MIWLALYLYALGAIAFAAECQEGGHKLAGSIMRGMAWPLIYTWCVVMATLVELRR